MRRSIIIDDVICLTDPFDVRLENAYEKLGSRGRRVAIADSDLIANDFVFKFVACCGHVYYSYFISIFLYSNNFKVKLLKCIRDQVQSIY